MAKRIQMTRHRPWREENPDAIVVSRPGPFGNPFTIKSANEVGYDRKSVVAAFKDWLDGNPWACGSETYEAQRQTILARLPELRGKNLACWCPLDQPCHADVLLELANAIERVDRAARPSDTENSDV